MEQREGSCRKIRISLKFLIAKILEQMISTITNSSLFIFHHEISELLNMARCLEHNLWCYTWAIHFKHVLFKNKMLKHQTGGRYDNALRRVGESNILRWRIGANLTPEGEDIGLDGATGRTVVVEAGNAAVDLEGRDVEEAALEGVGNGLTKCLSVLRLSSRVHL
nr:hypothetical protein Iba_chr06fCG8860 [Ipomoea batatas]